MFFQMEYGREYEDDFFVSSYCQDDPKRLREEIENFIEQNGGDRKIPYPLAWGYSDIFMIKKEKLYNISRLCGVFSAMNMFAEIALPTAIVLSVERQEVVVMADTEYEYELAWEEERVVLDGKYSNSVKCLYEEWEKEKLFIHPVKLSKWTVE